MDVNRRRRLRKQLAKQVNAGEGGQGDDGSAGNKSEAEVAAAHPDATSDASRKRKQSPNASASDHPDNSSGSGAYRPPGKNSGNDAHPAWDATAREMATAQGSANLPGASFWEAFQAMQASHMEQYMEMYRRSVAEQAKASDSDKVRSPVRSVQPSSFPASSTSMPLEMPFHPPAQAATTAVAAAGFAPAVPPHPLMGGDLFMEHMSAPNPAGREVGLHMTRFLNPPVSTR